MDERPVSSMSGVEENDKYGGKRKRLEATGPVSKSEEVRLALFDATATASPQGPAPITARSSINEPLSRHFDDLIAMRTHAHVLDGCVCKVLEPVQVGPGGRR